MVGEARGSLIRPSRSLRSIIYRKCEEKTQPNRTRGGRGGRGRVACLQPLGDLDVLQCVHSEAHDRSLTRLPSSALEEARERAEELKAQFALERDRGRSTARR